MFGKGRGIPDRTAKGKVQGCLQGLAGRRFGMAGAGI